MPAARYFLNRSKSSPAVHEQIIGQRTSITPCPAIVLHNRNIETTHTLWEATTPESRRKAVMRGALQPASGPPWATAVCSAIVSAAPPPRGGLARPVSANYDSLPHNKSDILSEVMLGTDFSIYDWRMSSRSDHNSHGLRVYRHNSSFLLVTRHCLSKFFGYNVTATMKHAAAATVYMLQCRYTTESKDSLPVVVLATAFGPFCCFSFSSNLANSCIATSSS